VLQDNHPLRRARWIWPPTLERPYNTFADFRVDFDLAEVPKRAPLYITADQCYVLYVNGQYAVRGPARGYQSNWPFDEVDVASFVTAGHNWLAVRAYNAGSSTFGYLHQGKAGLLCAGRWGGVDVSSGDQWLCRINPGQRRYTARMSMQLNHQEHFDSRADDERWIRNASAPKNWAKPQENRAFGSMPWHGCEARGIAHLTRDVLPYSHTCGQAAGRCGKGYRDAENLTDVFRDENRAATWQTEQYVTAGKAGLSIEIPRTGPDRYHAKICDFGRQCFGTLLVQARDAEGGEIVDFFACEALDDAGRPILPERGAACWASMSMRLILRRGTTRHEFMHPLGHRFLVAIVRNTRRPIRLRLSLRQTIYPMHVRGRFTCDDDELQNIYDMCLNTQRNCALDSYVDTPWREQAQWWGDARVQAWNTFHLAHDPALLRRGIRLLAEQEVPNGLTYGHAPTIAHECILPDFTLTWLLTLWDYYWQTGDIALFIEQWPRAQRALGYFETEGVGRWGLLGYDDRYWLFLDWTDLHRIGTSTLLNLWYVLTLDKLAELCAVADMPAEREALRTRRKEMIERIDRYLFDRRAGLFRDGLTGAGKPVPVHSVHSQTLALLAGIAPDDAAEHMIATRLLPLVRDEDVPGARPSSYWITYVYDVLEQFGHGLAVIDHLRRWWRPMLRYGGACENWLDVPVTVDGVAVSGIGHLTCSHAWAAHPIFHLARTLGGITQTDVAWRRIRFAPVLDAEGPANVQVAVPTPHGLIRSQWQRKSHAIEVRLNLPKPIVADVELPQHRQTVDGGINRWDVQPLAGV